MTVTYARIPPEDLELDPTETLLTKPGESKKLRDRSQKYLPDKVSVHQVLTLLAKNRATFLLTSLGLILTWVIIFQPLVGTLLPNSEHPWQVTEVSHLQNVDVQNTDISTSAIDIDWNFYPDYSIYPGDDFYQFANHHWLKNHPIPPDFNNYDTLSILRLANREKIKGILESKKYQDEIAAQIYRAGMDFETLNRQGCLAIQTEIDKILQATTKEELFKYGVVDRTKAMQSTLFSLRVSSDIDNPKIDILHMSQSGLALPDRDYYLEDSKREILEAYTGWLRVVSHYRLLKK